MQEKEVTENLDETNQSPSMGPTKQASPNSDSHNSNYALVNYESNSQTVDEHTENQYSTINMSSMHWTDLIEIGLLIAAGLLFPKHFLRYLKNRKKKEQARRLAELVFQIQGTIPLSTYSINSSYASAPAPMLEDKRGDNNRGSRSSVFIIYEP